MHENASKIHWEISMKNFEENYIRWLDGDLPVSLRVGFEQELKNRGIPLSEQAGQIRLGSKLKEYLGADSELQNADFFNHRIMERIRRDEAASAPGTASRQPAGWFGLSRFARLAWAGVFCMAVAAALIMMLRPFNNPPAPVATRVLQAEPYADGVAATILPARENQYAVIWLDGLDYIPAEHTIQ